MSGLIDGFRVFLLDRQSIKKDEDCRSMSERCTCIRERIPRNLDIGTMEAECG